MALLVDDANWVSTACLTEKTRPPTFPFQLVPASQTIALPVPGKTFVPTAPVAPFVDIATPLLVTVKTIGTPFVTSLTIS